MSLAFILILIPRATTKNVATQTEGTTADNDNTVQSLLLFASHEALLSCILSTQLFSPISSLLFCMLSRAFMALSFLALFPSSCFAFHSFSSLLSGRKDRAMAEMRVL